jgi:hypothetical protein
LLGASAVIVACSEHFPRALDERSAPAIVIVDAAIADAEVEASIEVDAGDDDDDGGFSDADADAGAEAGTPDADPNACNVRLDAPPLVAGTHVPEGTAIDYDSNPPSSGPHYPIWANFQEYSHPVDDGYLVHSLEHGAILLLYKCDDAACPDTVAQLRAVRDAVTDDPECDPSIRVRIVIAPRPTNDVRVAASAWGFTYRADCVDAPSLAAFIAAHYGKGPEDFCSPGDATL